MRRPVSEDPHRRQWNLLFLSAFLFCLTKFSILLYISSNPMYHCLFLFLLSLYILSSVFSFLSFSVLASSIFFFFLLSSRSLSKYLRLSSWLTLIFFSAFYMVSSVCILTFSLPLPVFSLFPGISFQFSFFSLLFPFPSSAGEGIQGP